MSEELAADVAAAGRITIIEKVLQIVCRMTGMGFAALACVTDRRWVACAVHDELNSGLQPGAELPVDTTLCNEVRCNGEPIVIEHVDLDARYAGHPAPRLYRFQSYISVPVRHPDGSFFGTLCAIDPKPASLRNPQILDIFTLFAELIGFQLEMRDRLARTEHELTEERYTAQLREQLIAVLGHDLRNPLAAIEASAAALMVEPVDTQTLQLVELIQQSSARMADIITRLLDFARARLASALPGVPRAGCRLQEVLEQVVDELRAAAPGRRIVAAIHAEEPLTCDSGLIAQLVSNLLANALQHGDSGAPVELHACQDALSFQLSVTNRGPPIAAEALSRLTEPFERDAASAGRGGVGLGLYIAALIARAHRGSLQVQSDALETRFTFQMPR